MVLVVICGLFGLSIFWSGIRSIAKSQDSIFLTTLRKKADKNLREADKSLRARKIVPKPKIDWEAHVVTRRKSVGEAHVEALDFNLYTSHCILILQ